MKTLKLLSLLAVLPALALAQATIVTKEAEGEAAIVNKDEKKAFEEAQQQALRSAVEQSAGVRIDADTLVVNNQLVRDQVLTNTSGYVKAFEVVSKSSDKGVVKVKVKAQVITDSLDKDIAAARDLVKRMGRPTLVIVVQEQTIPLKQQAMVNSESLATVLTEVLKADGWDIKDPQAMNKKLRLEGAATLGSTEFKEISNLTKAAYVLYGKAVLRHQDGGGGLIPSTDSKGVQAFFPLTGEYDLALAATDSEDQILKVNGKLGVDPALMKSGKVTLTDSYERTAFDLIRARKDAIVEPARKAILEHLRDQAMNGRKIALSVSGLDGLAQAKDFQKALQAMKGVKETTADGFADGKASYRVSFLGSVEELGLAAESATFKKKKLAVVSASGNVLELKVGK